MVYHQIRLESFVVLTRCIWNTFHIYTFKVFEGETLKEIRENLTDEAINEILRTEFMLNV